MTSQVCGDGLWYFISKLCVERMCMMLKWFFAVFAVFFFVVVFYKLIVLGEWDSVIALWALVNMLMYDVETIKEKIK